MGKKEERKRQQARKHQVKEETGRASVLGMQELKHLFFHLLGTQPPQRFPYGVCPTEFPTSVFQQAVLSECDYF